jgi:molybdopterin-guanine dinucleotide biosynthesis protein A
VLCGGESRRMGRDKALLEVDGVAMARRVADALRDAGAHRVHALGGDAPALNAIGLEVRPDSSPGDGPLPATLQALEEGAADGDELVVVLSCDLLAPSPQAVRTVIRALLEAPASVAAVPAVGGHLQWTHAAWRTSAARLLRDRYDDGARSLRRAAADLRIVEVEGIPAAAVADADLPSDLPSDLA